MFYLKKLVSQGDISKALDMADYKLKRFHHDKRPMPKRTLHHMMKNLSFIIFLLEKEISQRRNYSKRYQIAGLLERAKRLEIEIAELGYVFTL